MNAILSYGLLLPLAGTTIGAASVFFMKKAMSRKLERGLAGFAAGVMTAASVWSLLIPAMEQAEGNWMPAFFGFWAGILLLLVLDEFVPHQHVGEDHPEGKPARLGKNTMMVFAVILHNIPEGIAVGVVLAGMMAQDGITAAAALALSLGIAIQNFPEGAIISLPLRNNGMSKMRAFIWGLFSGIVEPLAAILAIVLSSIVVPLLPVLLSFAAGAMVYVVVEELIPDMAKGPHWNGATLFFALGFSIMMVLDVALG